MDWARRVVMETVLLLRKVMKEHLEDVAAEAAALLAEHARQH